LNPTKKWVIYSLAHLCYAHGGKEECKMKSALLLIDIQNDYFPGGKNELFEPERAAERARRVLEYFRAASLPVFHIRHVSTRENATFFLPDTTGAEIHPLVLPREGEPVLVKHTPNAFVGTALERELRAQQPEQLVICGMMSHMCIDSTVRAATDLGFSVTLLEDACTTKDLTWDGVQIPAQTVHRAIMASLSGTFAHVINTEEWLASAEK
jgi:nicotinamidase-related amidase